jgi:hypothetical protein
VPAALAHRDLDDAAEFDVVGNGIGRPLLGFAKLEGDDRAVIEHGAAPAPWPEGRNGR